VVGEENTLVNAHHFIVWYTEGDVDKAANLISMDSNMVWGDLTAIGGPVPVTTEPANGSSGIALDSIICLNFGEDIDSVNFSDILITTATDTIKGLALVYDAGNDKIIIDHDSLVKMSNHTVTVPSGSIRNTNNIINPTIVFSFMSQDIIEIVEVSGNQVMIGPNPVDKNLYISGLKESMPVLLFDVNGRLIIEKKINSTGRLSMDGLAAGMYLLKIGNKEIQIIKE
jgi:hypothetical protein